MSRAHRLGQSKQVLVLRLVATGKFQYESLFPSNLYDDISSNTGEDQKTWKDLNESYYSQTFITIEEKMLRKALVKLKTEKEVIADGQFDMGTINTTMNDAIVSNNMSRTSSNRSFDIKAESIEKSLVNPSDEVDDMLSLHYIMNQLRYHYNPFVSSSIAYACNRRINAETSIPVSGLVSNPNISIEASEEDKRDISSILITKEMLRDWKSWEIFPQDQYEMIEADSMDSSDKMLMNRTMSRGSDDRHKQLNDRDASLNTINENRSHGRNEIEILLDERSKKSKRLINILEEECTEEEHQVSRTRILHIRKE